MRRRSLAFALAAAALPVRGLARPAARMLQLQPLGPARAEETHSALAVSRRSFSGAYRFSGWSRTVRQLRAAPANAWEVGWLFWNFVDNDHLYYFILKPNGWEVGKRDPRYAVPGVNDGQKIVATGESARLALGEWYHFEVRVNGAEAEIRIDGRLACRFRDTDAPPLTGGRVGLYVEDAQCQWRDITAPFADGFEAETPQPLADGSELAHWRIAFLGYGSGAVLPAGPLPD